MDNQKNNELQESNLYPGIVWDKEKNQWTCKITLDFKRELAGYFETKKEAFESYCNAIIKVNEYLVELEKELRDWE